MKTSVFSFILVLLLFIGSPLFSQEKWYAEFRPGLNFPLSDEEVKTGFGFNLSAGYNITTHLGAYAGWGWTQYKSQKNLFNAQNTYDVEETGYSFGLQFLLPITNSPQFSYLLRLGGIYNHIEVEDSNGNLSADSGHGFGWEAGAGVEMGIGMNWYFRPQLGYKSLTRNIELAGVSRDFELNNLTIGVGLAKKF